MVVWLLSIWICTGSGPQGWGECHAAPIVRFDTLRTCRAAARLDLAEHESHRAHCRHDANGPGPRAKPDA